MGLNVPLMLGEYEEIFQSQKKWKVDFTISKCLHKLYMLKSQILLFKLKIGRKSTMDVYAIFV